MSHVKTYYAGKYSRGGLWVWREMFEELANSRELIWRLFLKDLKAKYKQSVLGVAWALIMPFVMIGSFMYLNKAGIVDVGSANMPYPLFALLGITFWQVFATGLTSCTNSIVGQRDVVSKINFPKKALVIASLGQTVFEFLIRLILVGLAFAYYQIAPSWHAALLPIVMLPILLITLSLGFFLSLLNVVARDIANIVAVVIPFLMLITPVMYTPRTEGFTVVINKYNPVGTLVIFLRDLVVGNTVALFPDYCVVSLFSIVLFLCAWKALHVIEPRLAERV